MPWPDLTTEVKARVLALVRPATGGADPEWLAASVADALDTVHTDFLSILLGRGYTTAQVEAWAAGHGKPWLISTGFFLVCVDSRTDITDADGWKVEPSAVLDRRKDLLTVALTDNVGLVEPENADDAGSPLHGNVTFKGPQGRGETFRTTDGCFRPW